MFILLLTWPTPCTIRELCTLLFHCIMARNFILAYESLINLTVSESSYFLGFSNENFSKEGVTANGGLRGGAKGAMPPPWDNCPAPPWDFAPPWDVLPPPETLPLPETFPPPSKTFCPSPREKILFYNRFTQFLCHISEILLWRRVKLVWKSVFCSLNMWKNTCFFLPPPE